MKGTTYRDFLLQVITELVLSAKQLSYNNNSYSRHNIKKLTDALVGHTKKGIALSKLLLSLKTLIVSHI
jgi:hypothetical protein